MMVGDWETDLESTDWPRYDKLYSRTRLDGEGAKKW